MNNQLYQEALNIAFEAHKEQKDKGGMPYILHPLRLMFQFEATELRIIALLHDVIEDSNITLDMLKKRGFTQEILDALVALTRAPNESYDEFIQRIAHNKLACLVKIADIEDNLNVTRLPQLTEKDHQRISKYYKNLRYLKSLKL